VVKYGGLKTSIEEAWCQPAGADLTDWVTSIEEALALLDRGEIRVAEKSGGLWVVNDWVQKAILLYFRVRDMKPSEAGELRFRDKIPVKTDLASQEIRVVPPGTARYGSFLAPGCVLMPGYVNIGAYVGAGTMIDTWATVGTGAQIGSNVHIAGGAGIGGVLEPVQSRPVIIEDGVFVGSRCIVVEGAIIEEGAVLGAGCVITASSPIIDVRGEDPVIMKGLVPAGTVAIPGTWPRQFPAGEFHTACVLIIGKRQASTDRKTKINEILREFPLEL